MNFQESVAKCMSNFATFEGRASRGEFWWFYLFCLLIQWFAQIVFALTFDPAAGLVMSTLVSFVLGLILILLFEKIKSIRKA